MAKNLTPKTPTVHNPTHFNPADYEVVDYLDNKRPEYWLGMDLETWKADLAYWEAQMQRVLGSNWRSTCHKCVHCGNGSIRWITVCNHIPTGDTVVFGVDCTRRLEFTSAIEFKLALLKSKADARSASLKVWKARAEYLQSHPEVMAVFEVRDQAIHTRNRFLQDVLAKLDKYGSLSPKQAEAVVKSAARDHEFEAQKAVEATQPKGNAPIGRVQVSGVVVGLKEQCGDWGITLKMTIKLDNGSRVWVTVPSGETVNRGDRVEVVATWEVSNTDQSFAFGKRPTGFVNHTEMAALAAPAAWAS